MWPSMPGGTTCSRTVALPASSTRMYSLSSKAIWIARRKAIRSLPLPPSVGSLMLKNDSSTVGDGSRTSFRPRAASSGLSFPR